MELVDALYALTRSGLPARQLSSIPLPDSNIPAAPANAVTPQLALSMMRNEIESGSISNNKPVLKLLLLLDFMKVWALWMQKIDVARGCCIEQTDFPWNKQGSNGYNFIGIKGELTSLRASGCNQSKGSFDSFWFGVGWRILDDDIITGKNKNWGNNDPTIALGGAVPTAATAAATPAAATAVATAAATPTGAATAPTWPLCGNSSGTSTATPTQ